MAALNQMLQCNGWRTDTATHAIQHKASHMDEHKTRRQEKPEEKRRK